MTVLCGALAVLGWALAGWLYLQWRRKPQTVLARPADRSAPEWYLMVQASGQPESLRRLQGHPQPVIHRPRGKNPALRYNRIGTAVIYKAQQS